MREDYTGEESIPEIDDSDHPLSENNEETGNAKETIENEEPKKKSLREDDFFEFATTKPKKEDEDIKGLRYIQKVDSVSDLDGAVGVLVLARELKSGLGIDGAMLLNDDWLNRMAEGHHGRFVSSDEFVKSK